jgi:uncharacterized protein (TIGR02145 family)
MVENLKTTKYLNGSPIPNVTDNTQWDHLTTGAYCSYNNDASTGANYGKLYNWHAVTNSRIIAPIGWHVATDSEWTTLENYVAANLGTSVSVAKALASKTDWASSNFIGTIGSDLTKNNSYGLTARQGDYRDFSGAYGYVGDYSYWWSSSAHSTSYTWYRYLYYGFSNVRSDFDFSVRCVKD